MDSTYPNNDQLPQNIGTDVKTTTIKDIDTTESDDVPDGGYGWVVVFCAFSINVLVDGILLSFGVLLPTLVKEFNENTSKVALVGTLTIGALLFSGPFCGAIIDKFGCRSAIIAGSIGTAIALVSGSFSPNVNVLIVVYGIGGGIGLGLMYLPVYVSVGHYFNKKRGMATGIAICGSGIGTLVYPPLIEYLLNEYDWKKTLWILAGMTLTGIFCGIFVRPPKIAHDKRKSQKGNTKGEIGPCESSTDDKTRSNSLEIPITPSGKLQSHISQITGNFNEYQFKHSKEEKTEEDYTFSGIKNRPNTEEQLRIIKQMKEYLALLKNLPFLFMLIGAVFGMVAFTIPFTYIVDRALLLGISSKKAAFLLSIIGIVITISRIGAGVVISLFGVKAMIVSVVAVILGGVAGFLQRFCNEYSLLVVCCILFGFSGVYVSTTTVICSDMLGATKIVYGTGLLFVAWGIGCVSGPYIAGLVYEATNSYDASFYLCGGSYFATALAHIIAGIILRRKNNTEYEVNISPN